MTVANFCYLLSVCVCVCSRLLSHVPLFVTLETASDQTPLSMGFSRQAYWSRLPFPILGNLPNPGIKSMSSESPGLTSRSFTTVPPGKPLCCLAAATAAKSLQPCLTLCDPIDGSPPGTPFPGILQARVLKWDAITFSNVTKRNIFKSIFIKIH